MRSGRSRLPWAFSPPGGSAASWSRCSSSAGSRAKVRFSVPLVGIKEMDTSMDPAIAFRVRTPERPALEVRVNFGVYSGRNATPAEIDDLARCLRAEVPTFAVVAEERHQFGDGM